MLSRTDVQFFKMAVGTANIGKETDVDIEARCPICGDSSKKKNSKRLHLYNKGEITNVNCFNGDCSCTNKTMYSFLRDFYPELLPQYKRETFSKQIDSLKETLGDSVTLKPKEEIKRVKPVVTQDLSQFMRVLDSGETQEAIGYLKNRDITYDGSFGKWYYGYQDLKIGDILYKITDSIVIPLYYENEMYGFYSRSIKEKNFITYMNDANIGYKIWNWFNVNLDEPVYIFEGIFDAISSGKKNIIALLGAKLPDERLKEMKHPVFCLDADKTGLLNSLNYAKLNHYVYIQPPEIKEKDMNEIKLNHPELDIPSVIDQNLYTGLSAQVRIKGLL